MNTIHTVLYVALVCCCIVNAQNDDSLSRTDRQCVTPEGKPGECISLHACPALRLMLLTPPVSKETIQLVRDSKCNGVNRYSVCRDLNSISKDVSGDNCAAAMSALLPDPTSECCGNDATLINKIAGAKPTAIDQFPWTALIEYQRAVAIQLLCAGVLISGKYVLTAGQCLVQPSSTIGKPVYVRLGEYDISNEGPDCITTEDNGIDCSDDVTRIAIVKTIPHPEFDRHSRLKRHDIGLVRMKEIAPYNDFIRPICLPTFNIKLKTAPFNLTVAGWGDISNNQRNNSIKLHVDLPYVNLDQCQEPYAFSKRKVELWKGQICAGGQKGMDTCKGDTGGPLMFANGRTYEVVGIISFGKIPCFPGLVDVPGVYTNIYEYMDWIRSNIVP